MATECTRDAIQRFLTERGGRVPHADLTHHFRRVFPEDDPPRRSALRETFKAHVDALACVRVEDGVRLVCLKKRYMRLVTPRAPAVTVDAAAAAAAADPRVAIGNGTGTARAEPVAIPAPADLRARRDGDGDGDGDAAISPSLRARGTAPGSDYGNDDSEEWRASAPPVPQVNIPASPCAPSTSTTTSTTPAESSSTSDAHGESDMGSRWSSHGAKTLSIERCGARNEPPRIAVTAASPLPASGDGSVFVLPPGTAPRGTASPGTPRHASAAADESQRQVRCFDKSLTSDDEDVFGRDNNDGGGGAGGQVGSPQALRSMSQRNASFSLSARRGDADGDAASLASSTDDGSSSSSSASAAAAALDPLEHEWMMCASDGAWERLAALLAGEPSLLLRRDFVTGFSLLHWAAKRGDAELLALAVNFAKRRGVAVDVDARSSCGYTPLHLAALHGHMEVVKLLVGAYDADVDARDYGGKRAGQYLADGAAVDIRDIIGAFDDDDGGGGGGGEDGREEGARWSFLRPLRMSGPGDGEAGGDGGGGRRARAKPLRRMSSLGHVKPRLQRLRDRTSQIVHSASFRELGAGQPPRPRSEYVPRADPPH